MKSRITRLAAAAVITMTVLLVIHQFGDSIDVASVAWAEVLDAFNDASDIHIIETRFTSDGDITRERELWFSNGFYREEWEHKSIIGDGENRLLLNKRDKTAELTNDAGSTRGFLPIDLLEAFVEYDEEELAGRSVAPDPRIMLVEESNDVVLVYVFVTGRHRGKAWVDAQSRLPLGIAGVVITDRAYMVLSTRPKPESEIWSDPNRTEKFELVFEYKPIPHEVFSFAIPDGYTVRQ